MRPAVLILPCLLAACSPTVPDDRAIQVISGPAVDAETQEIETQEIETSEVEVVEIESDVVEAPPEVETRPIVDTSAQCDEDTYKPLVGQLAGGRQFPVGPRLRVFGTNDIITQELVPQRTNIVVDDSGKIVRVYCG